MATTAMYQRRMKRAQMIRGATRLARQDMDGAAAAHAANPNDDTWDAYSFARECYLALADMQP